jgi:23S rRNA pseudouridine1911/1915/1917 synthase
VSAPAAVVVLPAEAGRRLDVFLAARFPERSRSFLQRLVIGGAVTVNGRTPRKADQLAAGDQVTIAWPVARPLTLGAEHVPLPVLFEDGDLLVINKPAGLTVHPGAGTQAGTLVNALLGYDFEQFSPLVDAAGRPGIVHRLDKDTSGVLVVARTLQAKAALAAAFAARRVAKRYLACVDGRLPQPEVAVETLIGRHPVHRQKMAVVTRNGKPAASRFRELAWAGGASLVEAELHTGRTHQLRVHLQHLGCPVVGDAVYGRPRSAFAAPRQLLHAWVLAFPHPRTGERRQFVAPPPADFVAFAAAQGLALPAPPA